MFYHLNKNNFGWPATQDNIVYRNKKKVINATDKRVPEI